MIEVLARMRLPVAPILPDEVARKSDIITGEAPNYSLAAVDTGVLWIDGQAVWRRVFILTSGAAINTDNTVLNIPAGWGFHGLVRLDGYLASTTDVRYPLTYYGAAADYVSVRMTAAGNIIERHAPADKNNRPMILIIDYISYPSGTSSWDGGISAWDGGASTWDQP